MKRSMPPDSTPPASGPPAPRQGHTAPPLPALGDLVEVRTWGQADWTAARVVGRHGTEVTVAGDLKWYRRSPDGQAWGWRRPAGGGR